MSLTLREATGADDAALVRLAARAPMQGDISLCIEREPSFFALRDLRGESRTIVADVAGSLVGCVSVTRRRVHWAGPRDVVYVADLKVLPAFRRAGVARALVGEVVRRAAAAPPADATLHVATYAAGNDALHRLLASSGISLAPLGRHVALQLLPWGARLRSGRTGRGSRATRADSEELLEVLRRGFARRRLAPWVEAWERVDVPIESFRVARRSGRIAAALAVWDGSAVKQTRVVRVPFALRAVRRVSALLPRSLAASALPREQSMLSFRYVRYATCEDDARDLLASLLESAVLDSARRGDHFLSFAGDARDPVMRAARGIPKLTYRYDIGGWHPTAAIDRAADPAHLTYDDPALS